jgi:hypothetical protein
MNQESEQQSPEFDAEGLYLEENITDRRVGSIRRLAPITRSGEPDPSRPIIYSGMAQVMTAAGPMPLNFDIPGDNLDEVCDNFAQCAQEAVEDMAQKLEEMRRDQASQIVVPGQGTSGGSGIIGA